MELNHKKALIVAGISGGVYLIFPIILINVLQNLNLLHFSSSFTLLIILFGIIHVIMAFLQYIFPKDSLNNSLIGLGSALFSGIYLFYIFGGFTFRGDFGNYAVKTEELSAFLGLQIFAWVLLIAAVLNTLYYLIRCIEIRRIKEYFLKKPYLRIRSILRGASFVLYLLLGLYILSIAISGLGIAFHTKDSYDFSWDDNSTLFVYDDDRITVTAYFDVANEGVYSIQNIILNADIFTINTSDTLQLTLPDNTKIGEVKDVYYEKFIALRTTYNVTFNIDILPQFVPGLIFYDANFKIDVNLICFYAGINIDLNISIQTYWSSLI